MFIKNNKYKILTPMGFVNFSGITYMGQKDLLEIKTEKGYITVVSLDHPFEVLSITHKASELSIGDCIDTKNGIDKIISIKSKACDDVYDINDVSDCRNYYGDEILHHNCFLGSTYTLVDLAKMADRKSELFKTPPVHQDFSIKEFSAKIWEPPQRNHVYVIGVDVADGTGNDYSVATVYDITTPTKGVKQVASFDNNKITPAKLAFVVAKLGAFYNVAPLMIEYNNMGETVVEFLHLLYEYPNIASIGHQKLGIRSHKNLKINACQNFRDLFDGEFLNVEINEMQLMTQLEYFEKKVVGGGGTNDFTYRATAGNNDDQVLANVWALYILERANLDYFFDADYTMIGMRELPVYCQQFNDTWVSDQRDILMKIDSTYEEIHNKEVATQMNNDYGYGYDDDYIRSL